MTALLRPAPASRRDARPSSDPHSVGPLRPALRLLDRSAPPARPPRDRRRLAVVGGGLLFAAVLAGNVAVQAQAAQGQFELERLQATARQRQASYQQLRLRVAELEAPQHIADRARQLGMVEPDVVTYLTPTASTSSDAGALAEPVATADEAAQSWAYVKRHLESR